MCGGGFYTFLLSFIFFNVSCSCNAEKFSKFILNYEMCCNAWQDGVITDLQQTIIAIINGAELPLSLLIVGVGGADFTEMEVIHSLCERSIIDMLETEFQKWVSVLPPESVCYGIHFSNLVCCYIQFTEIYMYSDLVCSSILDIFSDPLGWFCSDSGC